jgi:hypothetical protein
MSNVSSLSSPSPGATSPMARVAARWLRPVAGVSLLLLAVQFLVGMLVNLFVIVPDQHPGTNAPEYFSGVAQGVLWALGNSEWELRLHAVVGLLLALASMALIIFAIVLRRRSWIITSILGFIGIFAAGFNGASFMNYGHDFSSLLMSIGFLLAVISYALGLYYTR